MPEHLTILSPKRDRRIQTGWECFFPYYAGYSERFAQVVLGTARLPPCAVVFDPWNGSGTTTYAAKQHRLRSIGHDINPVMSIVARSRLLPSSEADALHPVAQTILERANDTSECEERDPLSIWFSSRTATALRRLERSIAQVLVGPLAISDTKFHSEKLSGIAAANYVALFNVCRAALQPFRTSNPTWVRSPRENEDRVDITPTAIHQLYLNRIESLQHILAKRLDNVSDLAVHEILTKDSTETALPAESVDFVLTSPPYCTRIDYVAATKIELAILHFLCRNNWQNLSRRMLGTTRVCAINAEPEGEWGPTCIDFLTKMRGHHSKASASYYFKTHLDYFQKLHRSLSVISRAMKRRALGIFVVQGSYYKEIHNDLPRILSEMASSQHLELKRREDFFSSRSMSVVNPNSRRYKRDSGAVESVLCFTKI